MPTLSVAIQAAATGACEGGTRPQKAGAKAAGKPEETFAQAAALADARQQAKAGTTAPTGVAEGCLLAGDIAVAAMKSSSQSVHPAEAKLSKHKIVATGAKVQSPKIPTQDAECSISVCPAPVPAGVTQPAGTPDVTVSVEQKGLSKAQGTTIPASARSLTKSVPHGTTTARNLPAGQIDLPHHPEGGAGKGEKAASASATSQAQATVGKQPSTAKAVSSGVPGGGQSETATKSQTGAVHSHIIGTSQVNAEPPAQPSLKTGTQIPKQSSKSHMPAVEQPQQAKQGKPQAENGKLSTETPRAPEQESRVPRAETGTTHEMRSVGRPAASPLAIAGGKETGLSEANDHEVARSASAVLEAGRVMTASPNAPSQAAMTEGSQATVARNPAQDISEQIVDSMRASFTRGEQQVEVRLHPPELGSVLVRFEEREEHIRGILEVSRNETRLEIERALPEVMRSLQDAGIPVRKLDVTLHDAWERDLSRGLLQQQGQPQQQSSDQQPDQPQRSPGGAWSFEGRPEQDNVERLEPTAASAGVSVGRIDMLV